MRELQQEKRAIEAQLKSIRAESSRPQSPSVLKPPSDHPPANRTSFNGSLRTTLNEPVFQPSVHSRPVNPPSNSYRGGSPPASPSPANSEQRPSKQSPPARPRQRIQAYPFPNDRPVSSELAATVERLQQQAEFYVHQFNRLQTPTLQTPREVLSQAFQVLDAHVQHINQLSAIQESAILELKTMAEKVGREWADLERIAYSEAGKKAANLEAFPICEYEETAVPKIEKTPDGTYVLTARSIDLFKAEREANLTAQALRHFSERDRSAASDRGLWTWLSEFFMFSEPEPDVPAEPRSPQMNPSPSRSHEHRSQANTAPHPPRSQHPPSAVRYRSDSRRLDSRQTRSRRANSRRSAASIGFNIREAAALFVGAVLVRVLLNLVIAAVPTLWTPAIALLMTTPAAIVVYRTSRSPQSELSWVYRLLLIMLGLLVGGRL